jgi:choline monooxygenase
VRLSHTTNHLSPYAVGLNIATFWWSVGAGRFVEESLAASDEVQQEDTELCQGVQHGLESAAYDVGR